MAPIPYDGIVTFVAFLIGIPALVIQTMTPEVRRAVMKHPLRLLLWAGIPTLFAIALIVGGIVATNPILKPSPAASAPSDESVSTLAPLPANDATLDESPTNRQAWAIVVGALLGLTIVAAFLITKRYGQRETVINQLRDQATQTLKSKNHLDGKALETLIELGEQSTPGEDKHLVLTALNELVDHVCRRAEYQGDTLETLITRLVDILASDSQPGTSRNFYTAAEILQRIVVATHHKPRKVDLMYAIQAVSQLSRVALAHPASNIEIENTLMNCIESLGLAANLYPAATTEVSEVLFKIGIRAIETKEELVAVTALANLLSLVQANQPARGELVADALGLASHFWVDGPTAREHVQNKLAELQGAFAQNLHDALETARHHCMQTTLFETADHLHQMLQDLYNPQK